MVLPSKIDEAVTVTTFTAKGTVLQKCFDVWHSLSRCPGCGNREVFGNAALDVVDGIENDFLSS